MDVGKYSLEELLLTAIRAEIDSARIYGELAEKTENMYLKDRLKFLSSEEVKHRQTLEDIFRENMEGREPEPPETTPVPLPEITVGQGMPLSEVLASAMVAERAASEFYLAMIEKVDNPKQRITLTYFASMEMGHYKILEVEKENAERYEEFDDVNPMMHAGP